MRGISRKLERFLGYEVLDREIRRLGQTFGRDGLRAVEVIQPGVAARREREDAGRGSLHAGESFQSSLVPVQDHVSLAHRTPIPRLVEVRIDLPRKPE